MLFEEALIYLRDSKKVRRSVWDQGCHLRMEKPAVGEGWLPFLSYVLPLGKNFEYDIDSYDILAEDWEIME